MKATLPRFVVQDKHLYLSHHSTFMKKILLVLFVISFFLSSCNKNETTIRAIVYKWNEIHNTHNSIELIDLYASRVLFYGREIGLDSCYAKKERFLNSSFQQEIISPVTLTYYSSGTIKCDFTKQTTFKKKENQYFCYLLIKNIRGQYRITGESDVVSDQNKGVQLYLGKEVLSPSAKTKIYTIVFMLVIISVIISLVLRFKRKPKQLLKRKLSWPQKNKTSEEESQKGYDFEKFIVERFDDAYFNLLEWRSDKFHNGKFPISSTLPDLEYEFNSNRHRIKFAVECKWRKSFFDYKIEWAKPYQITNYKNYEAANGIKVFIVIGVGGLPENPASVYIVPLHHISDSIFTEYQLRPYQRYKKGNFFLTVETMTLE
jgi:uncharacterized membrane protein YtjA (UPF0391 family)